MRKTFMGVRLRSLRAERGMTQAALAQALGLSPSYLNQIEQDQRPLTASVLLKIHRVLDVDIQQFSEDEEARFVAQLQDALADNPAGETVDQAELREVAAKLPKIGRILLAMQRRHQEDQQRHEALAAGLDDVRGGPAPSGRPMPYEAVRDVFFAHRNYFHPLDTAAEQLATEACAHGGQLADWLGARLLARHGVHIMSTNTGTQGALRHFDPYSRILQLSGQLRPAQRAFQMATQLALLEQATEIDTLVQQAALDHDAARLLRLGLANYLAGALLLPYTLFLKTAETLRYDIDLLAQRFGVGFETVCHRLSTLQRPQASGVPFFFIRVDRAGNISKRQSATHFHFSRTGGTCPLWNVYEAFAKPGEVQRQIARMPDGRTYLWIARTVNHSEGGFGAPRKTFSIGLGCDVRHAGRLVYAKGLDWKDPDVATPIGMGCKVCERPNCPQRAFPFTGRPLDVDTNQSRFAPYAAAGQGPDTTPLVQ